MNAGPIFCIVLAICAAFLAMDAGEDR